MWIVGDLKAVQRVDTHSPSHSGVGAICGSWETSARPLRTRLTLKYKILK